MERSRTVNVFVRFVLFVIVGVRGHMGHFVNMVCRLKLNRSLSGRKR